jgi:hypothetical protein
VGKNGMRLRNQANGNKLPYLDCRAVLPQALLLRR